MAIKNIVFDVGNVLVRWDPYSVIRSVFPEQDPMQFYAAMRPIWLDLNKGKYSVKEGIALYENQLGIKAEKMKQLMDELKKHQVSIAGSLALLKKLYSMGFDLYSITNNIKEFIEYHRTHSNFLPYFKGVVVSADIGILKPDPAIYKYLLKQYHLDPAECVFIDDVLANVAGALAVGMYAFQFTDTKTCEEKLIELGLTL